MSLLGDCVFFKHGTYILELQHSHISQNDPDLILNSQAIETCATNLKTASSFLKRKSVAVLGKSLTTVFRFISDQTL